MEKSERSYSPKEDQRREDEQKVLSLLDSFQPHPSDHFYKRLADAPWKHSEALHPRVLQTKIRRPGLLTMATAVVTIFLLIIAFANPSVRATAQRFAQFFIPGNSDSLPVEIGPVDSDYTYNLTMDQAGEMAGFAVKQPTILPNEVYLGGAAYAPATNTVILDYQTDNSNQIIRVTQRTGQFMENIARIGVNAEVETVQFGSLTGEYVIGGWRLPEIAPSLKSAGPGMKVTLEANWDPEAKIQILRWQEGNMFYEILTIGATTPHLDDLAKEDLIAAAMSME
jgi:hypothetical protein